MKTAYACSKSGVERKAKRKMSLHEIPNGYEIFPSPANCFVAPFEKRGSMLIVGDFRNPEDRPKRNAGRLGQAASPRRGIKPIARGIAPENGISG